MLDHGAALDVGDDLLGDDAAAISALASGSRIANSSPPSRATASELRRRVAQEVGDGHDQLVAGLVPERVVDCLEVVEVEHEQRAAVPVAIDVCDVALELRLEPAPVQQAGERIVVGHVAQLALEHAGAR